MEQEMQRRRPEAGVSPPGSHSLPLAPPSSHSSSPLLFCLFSSVYFSSHDSLHRASPDQFIKRIIPSSSQLHSSLAHRWPTDIIKHSLGCQSHRVPETCWHLITTAANFWNVWLSLVTLKQNTRTSGNIVSFPHSTVRVIAGYLLQGITRAWTESDSPHDTKRVLTLSQSVPLDVQHASSHLSPILPF